jgi:hypothetical protein
MENGHRRMENGHYGEWAEDWDEEGSDGGGKELREEA